MTIRRQRTHQLNRQEFPEFAGGSFRNPQPRAVFSAEAALGRGHATRVLLNGAPVPYAVADDVVRLTAVPARSGAESARLGVMVRGVKLELHLSGRLEFVLPMVSWETHVLLVALHLPAVFDYSWVAGSLAPDETSGDAEPSHDLPMPGKVLRFRQELISSSPDVAVSYAVDLKGQHFGGRGRGGESASSRSLGRPAHTSHPTPAARPSGPLPPVSRENALGAVRWRVPETSAILGP